MTFPYVFAPPRSAFANISLRTSNTVISSSTIIVPPGVVAGDLLYFVNVGSGSSVPPGAHIPTGFERLRYGAPLSIHFSDAYQNAWKIADGTESGTTLTGFTSGSLGIALLVFKAQASAVWMGPYATASAGTSGVPYTMPIDLSTANNTVPNILLASGLGYQGGETCTFDVGADGNISDSTGYANTAYKLYQTGASVSNAVATINDTSFLSGAAGEVLSILRNLPARTGVIGGAGGVGHNPSNLVDGTTATTANTDPMGDLTPLTVPQRLIFYVDLGVSQLISTIKAKQLKISASTGAFGLYYSVDNSTWTNFSSGDNSYSMTTTPTDFVCTNNAVDARYVGVVCDNVAWTALVCTIGELTIGISS